MDRRRVVAATAAAGVVGGACWVVKAAVIIATGSQPEILFEVAPLFFAGAVVGLWALLPGPRPGHATVGAVLAAVGGVAAVLVVAGLTYGPPDWEPGEDTATILTPAIVAEGVGPVVGLLLVGVAGRRTRTLAGPGSSVPVVLALSTVPLVALGPVLEAIQPRWFEVPTLVLGLGWVVVGLVVLRSGPRGGPPVRVSANRRGPAAGG